VLVDFVDPKTRARQLLAIGGIDEQGATLTSLEAFNGHSWTIKSGNPTTALKLSLNPWATEKASMARRRRFAAVSFNGMVYVCGGIDDPGDATLNEADWQASATVEFFDGTSWKSAPPMLHKRQGLAAVVFRGSLYVLGGFDGRNVLDSVERFDGNKWTLVSSMNCPRVSHSAAVYKNALYVIGGRAPCANREYDDHGRPWFEPIADVECFEGIGWKKAPKLLAPRAYHGNAVWNVDADAPFGSMERFVASAQRSPSPGAEDSARSPDVQVPSTTRDENLPVHQARRLGESSQEATATSMSVCG
jgi:hypothetical protein